MILDNGGIGLVSEEAGPKRTTSLLSRRVPLADPVAQLAALDRLALAGVDGQPASFARDAGAALPGGLRRSELQVFQINVGKLCNMTCRHCHVDAGPDRREIMTRETVDACLAALDRTGARTVDITGGAPELNPHFEYLVDACVERGVHVIDRCNLTILLLPRFAHLPAWLGERGVEVVASLPHHARRNTDAQRGDGVFDRSIEAIRRLNAVGYGAGDPRRVLTLMANPAGAFLAPEQAAEAHWKAQLQRRHGVSFDRLIALNNMPISRFLEWLEERDQLDAYMHKLVAAFNPTALFGVMCRNTVSIGWDGRVYDCDFNQMLALDVQAGGEPLHVRDLAAPALHAIPIRTARHCYGCTAGAGSSCGGATA